VVSNDAFNLIASVAQGRRLEPSGNVLVETISKADCPKLFRRDVPDVPEQMESAAIGFVPRIVRYGMLSERDMELHRKSYCGLNHAR
jgi:hypothetical protein